MNKTLILLSFSVFLSSLWAQDSQALTLSIHGEEVETTSEAVIDGRVLGAKVLNPTKLALGKNELLVPKGATLSFQPNKGIADDLQVAGLIINTRIKNQTWTTASGRALNLNCGRRPGVGAAFVHLGPNFELLDGCSATGNTLLKTKYDDDIIATDKSKLAFFLDGTVKASSRSKGKISLPNGSTVSLSPDTSLRYHDNGHLYFFYPKHGEHFTAQTEISDETFFKQPIDQDLFPILFHENGVISTGMLTGYNNYKVELKAYGADIDFSISSGPVGFDDAGNINRIVADKAFSLTVEETTYVRSTEVTTSIVSYGKFKPGSKIRFQPSTQLFLENSNGEKVLRGYPEQGNHGLMYFNELSNEPFQR